MKLIKVNRPISLNPLVEQEVYIPLREIIVIAAREDDTDGFYYRDMNNSQDLINWQELIYDTADDFYYQVKE